MASGARPQQRELVFCHPCENEWYRDEHGLQCPECGSDFTEIIDHDHDPRSASEPDLLHPTSHHDPTHWNAPDPDEGDIDQFDWNNSGLGQPLRGQGRPGREFTLGPDGRFQNRQGQDQGFAGGLMGLFGSALQSAMAPGPQHGQGNPFDQPRQQGMRSPTFVTSPNSPPGRPMGTAFVRHGHGDGYTYTITASSGGPQPMMMGPPDQIERLMMQMFMNIGANRQFPGGRGPFMMDPDQDHDPNARGGPGPNFNNSPFANLFQLIGLPAGNAAHGDFVHSQEGLDRIITQLMEQHQSGNAPGPATDEAIRNLPTKTITKDDMGEEGKAECSICMDEAALGSTVTALPCGHWFHFECIKAWLSEHDTCPHCRQGIMPKEGANPNAPRQPDQPPLHNMHSPEYHTSAMPGEYPFPPAHAGVYPSSSSPSSRPFRSPRSPSAPSSPGARRPSQSDRQSSSIFSRMRETFGGHGARGGNGGNPRPGSGR